MSLGARGPMTDYSWQAPPGVNGALQRRPSAHSSGGGRRKTEACHYDDCGNGIGGDSAVPHDEFQWTSLIMQNTNAGKSRHALRLYEQMQRGGVEPSSYTFVAALKACRRLKDLETAKHIHLQVVRNGLELDVYVGTMLADVYSRCGSVVDARQVFDKMPHRNVASWNSVILGYVQVGDSGEALQLFSRMQQEGVAANNQTFAGALKACSGLAALEEWSQAGGNFLKRRCLEKVRVIHSQLLKHGSEFSVFVWTLLVDVYVKCGSLVDARHAFENMPHRDEVSWNILILAYAQLEGGEESLQLYTRMQEEGLQPNDRTFVAALKACGSLAALENWKEVGAAAGRQSLEQVRAIHVQVVKSGCELSQFVGTMLVDVYGKCGSLVEARHVFERMPHRNVVCWTAMILGYTQMEESKEALQLFAQMQYEGVVPNDRTFVAALKACSHLATSRKGDAVDVKHQLKERCLRQVQVIHSNIVNLGVELDVFVGTMLLDAYAKCGSLVNARSTFEQMSNRNVVSWNSMILGYAQMEEGDKALQLYSQMQKEGLVPDERTFVAALKACSSLAASGRGNEVDRVVMKRCLQQVKGIHSHIRKCGCEAVVFVGTMLVDAYAKCGSLVDARSVFEQMPHRNVVSWNAMILGYSEMEEGQEALQLYTRMRQDGIVPDDGTFISALKACGVVAGLEKGKEIHAEMLNRLGFAATDLLLGTTLVDMYGKCGSMETAQLIFDALPIRDLVTWSALIAGYAQQGDSRAVFEKFQMMRQVAAIQPDGITFLSVLAVCSHVGLVAEGQMYFEAMTRDCGIIPAIDHCICVIDLLGRAGQVEEAMNMAMAMPQTNAVVWKTVLGACRKWRNVEVGRRAFESAVMLDKSDAATYVLMSNIYAAARMWEDVSKIKAMRIKTRALKQPGQSWWTDIGGTVHTFMVGDKKHPQIQEITSKLGDLEVEMKNGYLPHIDSVLQDISNDEKEAALCGHSERLAIACALLNTPKGTTVRVVKNLRLCEDCHSVIALSSQIEQRTIICRDARRFHVYKEGICSCGGYW